MEDDGISPLLFVILGLGFLYTCASPGVLPGFVDQYIVAPFLAFTRPQLAQKDVEIGSKLAEGGFGTVFKGKALASVPGQIRKGQVRRSQLSNLPVPHHQICTRPSCSTSPTQTHPPYCLCRVS